MGKQYLDYFSWLEHPYKINEHTTGSQSRPIMRVADYKLCKIFPNFQKKKGMIFHENRLPADDSHEISCLICYF